MPESGPSRAPNDTEPPPATGTASTPIAYFYLTGCPQLRPPQRPHGQPLALCARQDLTSRLPSVNGHRRPGR
jgi:hypothetical protein